MEGEVEWDAVAEALNAASSNPLPTTKNAKLFHSLVAECQVRSLLAEKDQSSKDLRST